MGSIFKKVEISLADSTSVTAFNRLRVANEGNRADVEFIYDKQDDLVDEVTTGAGTVTQELNTRELVIANGAATASDRASIYTYPCPYTPGNGQLIAITGVLDYAAIGGGTVELFLRSSISGTPVDLATFPQSEWSSLNKASDVDWTKSHIFELDFQSLKVGRIRFALNKSGIVVPIAEILNDNIRNSGYWQLPQQSVFWDIKNVGAETIIEIGYGDDDNAIGIRYTIPINASASMKAICATVKSEGGLNIQDIPGLNRGISNGTSLKTVSTTLIPLLSIRPKTTFNGFSNRGIALPKSINLYTNNPINIVILHDSVLTGASWADVDTNDSMMEYDVSASAVANGHPVLHDYAGGAKNTGASTGNILGRTILWNRRDPSVRTGILTVAAVRITTTSASVGAALNWGEIR
jgi:hypothetical protein